MSPGLTALPPGMFSTAATSPTTRSGRSQRRGEGQRGDHRRRAAHVELHLVHGRRILERDAAGVEGDALADQHHRGADGRFAAAVLEHDEARRLCAALRDRKQTAHFLAADRRLIEHRTRSERWRLASARACSARKVGVQTLPGRLARSRWTLRPRRWPRRARARARPRRCRALAHRARQHPLQARRLGLLAALEIVDAIERRAGDLRRPRGRSSSRRAPSRRAASIARATLAMRGARERRDRGRPGLAPGLAAEALLGAEAGEQHARGRDARQIGEQQRLGGRPEKSPRAEQLLQPPAARRVDGARLLAQLAFLEDAEDQAVHVECGQSLGPGSNCIQVSQSR